MGPGQTSERRRDGIYDDGEALRLEAEKPNHFAVRQYKKYKLAAGDATMGEQSNQLHIESPENRRYVTA